MSQAIHVRVPVRVDLAGGTVDLWPIYLLFRNAKTINLGINLFAEAEVSPNSQDEIILKSIDQEKEIALYPNDLESNRIEVPNSLAIHHELIRYFAKSYPDKSFKVKLTSIAKSPAGAGLGGSSALNVALTTALYCYVHQKTQVDIEEDGRAIIEIARDIESHILHGPAGLQDYFGAMYGGLQEIEWLPRWHKRTVFPDEIKTGIEDRLLLFYSGQSRNSGINNWDIYQNIVNQDKKSIEKIESIISATEQLCLALREKDWKGVGEAIKSEWEARKKLAKSISTREIDKAFEKAIKLGATATKICGAGGGGCFFVYLEKNDPDQKKQIIDSIEDLKMQHLPFEVAKSGIEKT